MKKTIKTVTFLSQPTVHSSHRVEKIVGLPNYYQAPIPCLAMLSSTPPLLSSKGSRILLIQSGILRMFFRNRIKRLTSARSNSKTLSRAERPSFLNKPNR